MRYFPCPFESCNKEFVRKADLTRHYQIHLDDRPFVCAEEGCTKRFHQRSSLKIDQRVHTGEKPYVCEIGNCKKAFSDPSSYARHQKSHKNERPYVCSNPSCLQSFSRKIALERHQLRQHGQDSRVSRNPEPGPSTPPSAWPTNIPPAFSFPPPSHLEGRYQEGSLDWRALDLSVVDDIVLRTIMDHTVPHPPYIDPGQHHRYPDLPPQ
ncbi:C2H2-type zinc finger protein [Aspergillus puulaauensis]|uniref:C2H2-type domain-containing protein n=1 Tax=Aspergillus puulaauensis TaxID=1220207 RepID=A0A7R7XKG8_9EURO|nr:uncharacterized protein APUU_31371S [Aspergillus puulaauensis]BCS23146.1 hypothetical protein APUU_31371S [Aspergillus puulaauensis]